MKEMAMGRSDQWAERHEFDSLHRHVSGFGVGRLIITDPVHGVLHVDLTRNELRELAMQALAAMGPATNGSTPEQDR